jgi:3-oxoacyl-(acyl-carrier-protein) synthase
MPRIVITGTGAVCAAGKHPEDIFAAVRDGHRAITEIRQWDASGWPTHVAAEITDFDAREMVEDRKLHKFIRRTDLIGL